MPTKGTVKKAKRDLRAGKRPSTAAGEFVHEEIDHVRRGKHGARSTKQAIAIGLSKARRAGVKLPPPEEGTTSEETRRSAMRANRAGSHPHKTSERRSRATREALRHEGRSAASHQAISRHASAAAHRRTAAERSASARKAARTRARNQH